MQYLIAPNEAQQREPPPPDPLCSGHIIFGCESALARPPQLDYVDDVAASVAATDDDDDDVDSGLGQPLLTLYQRKVGAGVDCAWQVRCSESPAWT